MKIYFSASVRGGRDNVEMYAEIIELLKDYGEVMTEYLGSKALSDQGQMDSSDENIYKRDVAWLKEADVLVADVSTPSVGVGYEIASAETLKKKVLCLYREGSPRKISGMINGNKNLIMKTYRNVDDLRYIINEFFK